MVLLVPLFAGGARDSATSSGPTLVDTESQYVKRLEPTAPISVNIQVNPDMKLMDGDTVVHNPYSRWVEQTVGLQFVPQWQVSNTESDIQKLNMALASNTLPDLITLSSSDTSQKLINAGRLLPLNTLIDTYGSPLTKYVIDLFQELTSDKFLAYFQKDGNYYAIPNMADVWAVTYYNLWFRKDILAQLGVEVPRNLEEFEVVMEAYKKAYPQGVAFTYSADPVIAAMGGATGKWVDDGSGNLVYGSILPVQKEILAKLNSWYTKGYLDKEFFTKHTDLLRNMQSFLQGNSLSCYGMWWYIYWPFPDLWATVDQAEVVAAPPLTGSDGIMRSIMDVKSPFSRGKAISSTFKHPESLIYLLNAHIDSVYRNNSEIRTLMKEEYGYEFIYPYEDKMLPINPEADPDKQKWNYQQEGPEFFNDFTGNPVHLYHGFHYAQGPNDLIEQYRRIAKALDSDTLHLLNNHDQSVYNDMKFGSGEKSLEAHFSNVRTYDTFASEVQLIVDDFNGPPTPTMVDKSAYLGKLEEETFSKIIIGELPLSSFDTFVQEWKRAGGDQITKEVNEWYVLNR